MILTDNNYVIISKNSNGVGNYWSDKFYPKWSSIITLWLSPDQKIGTGVEPHYHDHDEIWLFTKGNGEVWLDEQIYKITPNTIVYTPMGTIHRFQMFTDYETVALVTRLERNKRQMHILVKEHGLPEKTVSGFVVNGENNRGPFKIKNKRCPVFEFRQLYLSENEIIENNKLSCNEYWAVLEGDVFIRIGKLEVQLSTGDVALLKHELVRELRTNEGCRLALVKE